MFIKLDNQLFNSDLISVIKPIDDGRCSILMSGESVIDGGHLINLSAEEVEAELSKIEGNSMLRLADDLQDEIDEGKKLTHKEVKYENPAKGMDHCKDCVHYADVDDCDLVKAPISPKGWCVRFRAE
jgi:hypothetical protein